jgi:hypothetical protein
MNNTLDSQIKLLDKFVDIIYVYFLPSVGITSSLTNILSIIIFSRIVRNQRDGNKMFSYLLIKSCCDMIISMMISTVPMMYYIKSNVRFEYFTQIWNIWFIYYILCVLHLSSRLFEVMATLMCALSIDNRMKCCHKRSTFFAIIITILISFFLLRSYVLFDFKIYKYVIIGNNSNQIIYYTGMRNFSENTVKILNAFFITDSLIRDLLSLITLLLINIYIFYKLIQTNKRKRNLQNNNRSAGEILARGVEASKRKKKMVIVLFITFVIGHLPLCIYYLSLSNSIFWKFWVTVSELLSYIPYLLSFFIYLFFNNQFRKTLILIIKNIFLKE